MTASSSRPAGHTDCLVREEKEEQTGPLSWTSCAAYSWAWECTKVELISQQTLKRSPQPYSNKMNIIWELSKTTKVTPSEMYSLHWDLQCISKRPCPILRCWCHLTAKSGPLSLPLVGHRREKKERKRNLNICAICLSTHFNPPHPNQRHTCACIPLNYVDNIKNIIKLKTA